MVPAPVPYDLRWTAKLLRRDVRTLKKKAITKLKASFPPTSSKPSATFRSTTNSVKVKPIIPQCVQSTPLVPQNEVRNSRAPHAASSDIFVKHAETLYELLEGHLKTTWASRDRDVCHKNHWLFRGAWLVLWMALQACPSNTSYDIFEDPKADETALLLDLARITAAKTFSTTHRISKMPAAPFEGSNVHFRYDSVWDSDVSGAFNASKPTYSQLWHSILDGATDVTKTASAAKELLSCVWEGVNVDEILDAIGDPAKQFERDDDLRSEIRDLLIPSYAAFSSPLRR